ncbi:MAG TPA: adenylate/guanylate cyclase domain-containing protein [Candidatus Methylomirabilis sp.]|nr:adenylate/guanylate cyclase domain-containing protein [Candidatus Methylomirabilis sp.]
MSTADLRLSREVFLPGVTREQVWEWVADTDSLNRLAGLPPVQAEVMDAAFGNTKSRVQAHRLFPVTWEEGPFEFVRPVGYRVVRKFIGSPISVYHWGCDLKEEQGGVRLSFRADITLRSRLFGPLVRLIGSHDIDKIVGAFAKATEKFTRTGTPVYVQPPGPMATGAEERLAARMPLVRRASPALAPRLETFVHEAADVELMRMRPFELADRWGAPRMETLRMMLHAAKAEILNLTWDVLCPHCRVPSVRTDALADVEANGWCKVCNLTSTNDFDTAVEVSFAVHPSIRPIEPVQFCLGSPAKRHGLIFQQLLKVGERRPVDVFVPAGNYMLMRADSENRLALEVGDGEPRVAARIGLDGVTSGDAQPRVSSGPGMVRFDLANETGHDVRVGLALATPATDSASAAIVTTLQDFRDLFSSQVLAPGVQMSMATVTLLFTDLKGSTSLYESYGDAPIYVKVRDHFAVLTEAVRAENGTVVKTIGDAVMASFLTPVAGVRAALLMQQKIADLNTRIGQPALVVKVGLHSGPCLVVNANDRLDYFGNTVNHAARIEGQSKGADVVITEAVARDPEVVGILGGREVRVSTFEAALKGLTGTHRLTRLELPVAGCCLSFPRATHS